MDPHPLLIVGYLHYSYFLQVCGFPSYFLNVSWGKKVEHFK